jgi:hypothetical protein
MMAPENQIKPGLGENAGFGQRNLYFVDHVDLQV